MTLQSPLTCRLSGTPLDHVFVDLGMSPLSNAYVRKGEEQRMEPFFPLTTYISSESLLVQLPVFERPEEIFKDYAYFSSYSASWLQHAERYVEMMISRFALGSGSNVVELASNDGYLLQYFQQAGVPVLGVEPAANVAQAAIERGIATEIAFFGVETALRLRARGPRADVITANNVLAHVPDLNDFVAGMRELLAPTGVITVEFPHLACLIEGNQFDTIYHEHFSYFSFLTAERAFAQNGLSVFDVERLSTHGGSLRVYVQHASTGSRATGERVGALREWERTRGYHELETYLSFAPKVEATKRALLAFLIAAREQGKRVAAYGAAAKGNTLLNYCGIRRDFIDYIVDRNPHKQNVLLPGTRIPVFGPERLAATRPDYVLILPWNLREEIVEQLAEVREWGGRFVVPIPEVTVLG